MCISLYHFMIFAVCTEYRYMQGIDKVFNFVLTKVEKFPFHFRNMIVVIFLKGKYQSLLVTIQNP